MQPVSSPISTIQPSPANLANLGKPAGTLFAGRAIGPTAPADRVQFSGEKPEQPEADAEAKPAPKGKRTLQAALGALKAGFNPKGLMDDAIWSGILTAATFWLPGSQLATIPALFAIGFVFRAIGGFGAAMNGQPYEYQSTFGRILNRAKD